MSLLDIYKAIASWGCPGHSRYHNERELSAVRTKSLPLRRGCWRWSHDNADRQEGFDDQASPLRGRMQPAEMADAVRAGRERMLEEPAEELIGSQGAHPLRLRFRIYIIKTYSAIRVLDQFALTAHASAKHILSEILEGRSAGTDGFAIDHPVRAPDAVRDLGMQGRLFSLEASAQPCTEARRQDRLRQQEVRCGQRNPFRPVR